MFAERDSIRKNSITLSVVALITGTLLATTQSATKDKIALAQRQAEQKALLEILPMDQHSNDLLMDVVNIPEQYWAQLGLKKAERIHIGRDKYGNVSTLIFPTTAADGYSGAIKLIVGVHIDGTLAGVRITEHRETPGLGDKVELKKSPWVLDFNGKSLHNPERDRWAVKKDGGDFDQFTGATITPRAVINQVVNALDYFMRDKERLLKQTAKQTTTQSAKKAVKQITNQTNKLIHKPIHKDSQSPQPPGGSQP